MAKYRTVREFYKLGTMYPPGSIIEIGEGEKPAHSWILLDEKPEDPPEEKKPVRRKAEVRPSDADPSSVS